MTQPIGDAEGAEFREIAVVEDEDKVAGLVAQALDRMAVAARKIPDVARIEIVGLRVALRIGHGGAAAPFDDKGPFGRGGVPVQLAHYARLEPHRDAGDSLRDRQLQDGRLFAEAAIHHLARRFFQREFERRQVLARQQRVGHVVLEGKSFVGHGGRNSQNAGGSRRANKSASRYF
jgi:hypothetical protein